ncbi:MAG: protein-L-isoaspartate O-methyltransferase [Chloroflexi bacterium]|nr:protein-L-isoaspartate O-methyltransferase [Chloroflexota bacterium]|tara:strand:- start:16173 stop:16805 length:633 start_codon:yes stop_codon:yes gene_type:complete
MKSELQKSKTSLINKLKSQSNNNKIIKAFEKIPRELFIPDEYQHLAYEDTALPIEYNQTISQPSIIAKMINELDLSINDNVLEIGTGSGYLFAILSELVNNLTSTEIIEPLIKKTKIRLNSLGYNTNNIHLTNKALGCLKNSPFDRIIVSAAAKKIPDQLLKQLSNNGNLIIPIGSEQKQELLKITKTLKGLVTESLDSCKFVPLIFNKL